MQGYELLYILNPEAGEEKIGQLNEKVKKILTDKQAKMIAEEKVGERDLATPIDKHNKGYYIRLEFEAAGAAVQEMLELLKVSDIVLRQMCVKLESIREKNPEPVAAAEQK